MNELFFRGEQKAERREQHEMMAMKRKAESKLVRLLLVLHGFLFITPQTIAQKDNAQNTSQGFSVQLDDWSHSQVRFWVRVFSEWNSDQRVIHDSMNLARVYAVIKSQDQVDSERKRIRRELLEVATQIRKKSFPDQSLFWLELFEHSKDPSVYEFAADLPRLRVQAGLRDQLEKAFGFARIYLPRMEAIFKEEGVPIELTRLPFVESAFNSHATSHVGAAGIWQFMHGTALKDLKITKAIDERRDPLKATRAAARLLRKNFEMLGSWPLAAMAYHHGAGLVKRAIKKLKTNDPVKICRYYKNPSFKFASRNYLWEFLAIVEVDRQHQINSKNSNEPKLPEFITISSAMKIKLPEMIEKLRIKSAEVKILNPHFMEAAWAGREFIPAHYPIRLPGITLEEYRKSSYSK